MSFATIARSTDDEALAQRTRAAYAAEGVQDPSLAWNALRWPVCSDPSVAEPYASAVAGNNPNPGGDESVITDGMLTAAVQAHPFTPSG
jgi:hypothetical protein